MQLETVYVTVGTTNFHSLVREVLNNKVLKILKSRGCRNLILQVGNDKRLLLDEDLFRMKYDIAVEQYAFKEEPTRTDILKADLVIGHAGAGTCLDILHYKKPGLVVVNQQLMNNHQMELAQQLASDGHIYYCNLKQLAECLQTLDFAALKPYEQKTNMHKFVKHLQQMMES